MRTDSLGQSVVGDLRVQDQLEWFELRSFTSSRMWEELDISLVLKEVVVFSCVLELIR